MTLRNYSSTAAETTLSAGVDASATTLAVSAATGFPAAPFVLAIDAGAAAQELVLVTNVAGTNLTVTRAFDSTVAAAHDTGAAVQHSHAAIDFREANTHVNATSGAHGVTGSLVGTSDTQTLTGKSIDLTANTVTGSVAEFNAALEGADFATLAGTETLSGKTLTTPVINGTVTGTTFGAWTAYTPTRVGFTTSAMTAKYLQVGKLVHVSFQCTVSGASAPFTVALPVAAAAGAFVGTCVAGDAGTANHVGAVVLNSTTTVLFIPSPSSAGTYTTTIPFTWVAGDSLSFSFTYEAA